MAQLCTIFMTRLNEIAIFLPPNYISPRVTSGFLSSQVSPSWSAAAIGTIGTTSDTLNVQRTPRIYDEPDLITPFNTQFQPPVVAGHTDQDGAAFGWHRVGGRAG